jgi:hypothetical protein
VPQTTPPIWPRVDEKGAPSFTRFDLVAEILIFVLVLGYGAWVLRRAVLVGSSATLMIAMALVLVLAVEIIPIVQLRKRPTRLRETVGALTPAWLPLLALLIAISDLLSGY